MKYVDFHIHTEYTEGNGISKIPEIIKKAKVNGMKSLGIMDSGNINGFREFRDNCLNENIKAVYGCGFYFAPLGITESTTHHLPLIAKNEEGLNNLYVLTESGKRVDFDLIKKHSNGLIALTGGLGGVYEKPYIAGHKDLATSNIKKLKDIFKENFYIELQNNEVDNNLIMQSILVELSEKEGIPMIVSGGSFYVNRDDYMLCNKLRIKNGNKVLHGSGYYFKTPKEIKKLFASFPKQIENTVKIDLEIEELDSKIR